MAYTAVLTTYGKEQILSSGANWATMVLGDGTVTPMSTATAVGNAVYSAGLTKLTVEDDLATAVLIVPPADGGFTVREAGILDADGNMCVYATLPETYKPASGEGSVGNLTIRLRVALSDAAEITLTADPDITLATVEYVDEAVANITNFATARELITDLASEDAASFDGSADATIGVSGILPISHGGTGNASGTATALMNAVTLAVDLTTDDGVEFDGSADAVLGVSGILPASHGGTGNASGTATALTSAVNLSVSLEADGGVEFDGSEDVIVGVSGILPVAHGGTGANTLSEVTVGYAAMDADGNVIADTYATKTAVEDNDADIAALQTAVGAAQETADSAVTAAAAAQATADGKADEYHASEGNDYGLGTAELYGHVKVTDTLTVEETADTATAATPAGVLTVLADYATVTALAAVQTTAESALTTANTAVASAAAAQVTADAVRTAQIADEQDADAMVAAGLYYLTAATNAPSEAGYLEVLDDSEDARIVQRFNSVDGVSYSRTAAVTEQDVDIAADPTDADYWQESEDEATDEYDATATYYAGDLVLYGGVSYECIADNGVAIDSETVYTWTAWTGDYATTDYVDEAIENAPSAVAVTAVISTDAWTDGYADVTVADCTETMIAYVTISDESQDAAEACGLGATVTTYDGYVRFYADEAASEDITVTIVLLEVK